MTRKNFQHISIVISALTLSVATSAWTVGRLSAEGSYAATSSSSATTSQIQTNLPVIVGTPIKPELSALADTPVNKGGGVVATVTYDANGVIEDPKNQFPDSTVSKMSFRKCTFGISVLSGDSVMPFTSPNTGGVSFEAADPSDFTEYTNSSTQNFYYYTQSEYYKAFAFSPSYAKVDTIKAHNRLQFYIIGVVNNYLQAGQRFSVDAMACEATVQGWSGVYTFGSGKGFGATTEPMLTYIVNATSSSSSSTTSGSTSSASSSALPTNARIPLYRFYKAATGGHLYTVSESEKNKVISTLSSVFKYEGVRGEVLPATTTESEPDMVQVERFYNLYSGTHKYTYKPSEIALYKSTSYSKMFKAEGIRFTAFYKAKAGRLPMYEFYNKSTGGYFYTSKESEKNKVIANLPQFSYKGIVFYILPQPV
jgi:hypothetical protein